VHSTVQKWNAAQIQHTHNILIHTQMHIRTHTQTRTHAQSYTNAHTHTQSQTRVHTHTHSHTQYTHTHSHTIHTQNTHTLKHTIHTQNTHSNRNQQQCSVSKAAAAAEAACFDYAAGTHNSQLLRVSISHLPPSTKEAAAKRAMFHTNAYAHAHTAKLSCPAVSFFWVHGSANRKCLQTNETSRTVTVTVMVTVTVTLTFNCNCNWPQIIHAGHLTHLTTSRCRHLNLVLLLCSFCILVTSASTSVCLACLCSHRLISTSATVRLSFFFGRWGRS
jgi:hypothetical protein